MRIVQIDNRNFLPNTEKKGSNHYFDKMELGESLVSFLNYIQKLMSLP